VIVLVLVQCGTYWWRAESQMPLAGLRTVGGLEHRGEFVAFAKSTWSSLTPAQRAVLTASFAPRVRHIYHTEEEIPDANNVFRPLTDDDRRSFVALIGQSNLSGEMKAGFRRNLERGTKPVALQGGRLFHWHAEREGLFWMRCNSGFFVGELAAGGRSDLFIWFLGRWWRAWNFSHVVA
jgi:hypothetical protein